MEGLKFSEFNDNNESISKEPINYNDLCTKELTIKNAIEEMAYHEAAHFVFNVLITKQGHEFPYPKRVDFKVVKGERFTAEVVKSFTSGFGIIPFYVDEKLGFLLCLSLLSGYSSHRAFIQEEKCFIGPMPSILSESNEVVYYSIGLAIDRKEIQDIEECRKVLINIFRLENRKIKECIKSLQLLSEEVINNQKIKEGIIYVKEVLVDKNPSVIDGKELKKLVTNVESIISEIEIDLIKMFKDFKKELSSS